MSQYDNLIREMGDRINSPSSYVPIDQMFEARADILVYNLNKVNRAHPIEGIKLGRRTKEIGKQCVESVAFVLNLYGYFDDSSQMRALPWVIDRSRHEDDLSLIWHNHAVEEIEERRFRFPKTPKRTDVTSAYAVRLANPGASPFLVHNDYDDLTPYHKNALKQASDRMQQAPRSYIINQVSGVIDII